MLPPDEFDTANPAGPATGFGNALAIMAIIGGIGGLVALVLRSTLGRFPG